VSVGGIEMSKDIAKKTPSQPMTVTTVPVDRNAARGEQFTPVCNLLRDFLASDHEFVSLPVTFDEEAGYLEWTGEAPKPNEKAAWMPSEFVTYTRAEVVASMVALVGFREHANKAFQEQVPSYTSTEAQVLDMLSHEHEVLNGKNKGKVRNLVAHGMGNIRQKVRDDRKDIAVMTAVQKGTAFYAANDPTQKAFEYEGQARKQWCRCEYNIKDETGKVVQAWHEGKTKDEKKAMKAQAVITNTPSQVQVTPTPQPTVSAPVQEEVKLTVANISSMPSITVRNIAKNKGAPQTVYTGEGATINSITWLMTNGHVSLS
tara:strand:+ start:317 stop:1264 length:948 start_codon:yes stop_codon:yes gene_type:complete